MTPANSIPLYKRRAVGTLVDHGLNKEEVMAISKLGVTTVHKLLDVLTKEGAEGLTSLLAPIEGIEERALGALLDEVVRKYTSALLTLPSRAVCNLSSDSTTRELAGATSRRSLMASWPPLSI